MLYVTTRNKHDAYTAHRTQLSDRAPDGGLYVPFHMVSWERQQVMELAEKSFGQCIAQTLNQFFSCRLTSWDVEFSIGRYAAKTVDISHRIIVSEAWHNQASDYAWVEKALAEKICGNAEIGQTTVWLRIAIRIAFITGVFAELIKQGIADPEHPVDVAVPTGDFSIPMSMWYARKMGLPIANIICGCDEHSATWDLLHLGTVKTDVKLPECMELLVCETLGHAEALRYSNICKTGGVYSLLPVDAEQLRKGMFAAVISAERLASMIPSAYRTSGYVLGPGTAFGYGGLLDFRAKTGENRAALMLAERSPVCDCEFVAAAMGITVDELKEKFR